jgi:hypothetical protein
MSGPLELDEFFARLKAGYLQWRRQLSNARHSLSIFAPIPRRDASYRDLLHGLCDRWNADQDIASAGPRHVELALGNRGDSWIGCTTAKDPIGKRRSEQGDMRFVDYALLKQAIESQQRRAQGDEKAHRRANPVVHPVGLPLNIASEIANYLRLEYGETARGKNSVKARNLRFEGEFVVDGVPTQFWRYPTSDSSKRRWATVERFDDSYHLGTTSEPPPG